jgi:hypothetical protein
MAIRTVRRRLIFRTVDYLGLDSLQTATHMLKHCRRKSANSGRALKLLTFLVGQCHDDRIFIDAKELGRVVVGIAED